MRIPGSNVRSRKPNREDTLTSVKLLADELQVIFEAAPEVRMNDG